tara:strand:+ start:590 stop:1078 length:489 start_codon:yes stop_codon:yes gene_type:complete
MRLNYDEISPITGNMCVMVEPDSTKNQNMKLCMESGYQTFDSWKDGSEIVDTFLAASPQLIKNTSVVDATGNVWVKIIMMTPDVVLNPDLIEVEGDTYEDIWRVSSFTLLEEGVLPEPNIVSVQVGNRFKVLDESTSVIFKEFEFEEATLEFYKRVNESNEE